MLSSCSKIGDACTARPAGLEAHVHLTCQRHMALARVSGHPSCRLLQRLLHLHCLLRFAVLLYLCFLLPASAEPPSWASCLIKLVCAVAGKGTVFGFPVCCTFLQQGCFKQWQCS
jgi:hypothetical protein